jgi:hypothetical protein
MRSDFNPGSLLPMYLLPRLLSPDVSGGGSPPAPVGWRAGRGKESAALPSESLGRPRSRPASVCSIAANILTVGNPVLVVTDSSGNTACTLVVLPVKK